MLLIGGKITDNAAVSTQAESPQLPPGLAAKQYCFVSNFPLSSIVVALLCLVLKCSVARTINEIEIYRVSNMYVCPIPGSR